MLFWIFLTVIHLILPQKIRLSADPVIPGNDFFLSSKRFAANVNVSNLDPNLVPRSHSVFPWPWEIWVRDYLDP